MTIRRHTVTVGDTLTPLGAQLMRKNSSGSLVAVDLAGLVVKFTMINSDGAVVVAETSTGITIITAVDGKIQYDFRPADVSTVGTYYAWFTVYNGTERDTYPTGGRLFIVKVVRAAA